MDSYPSPKIRIAWFTPSPTEPASLSEVFSNQILPILSKSFDVKVYTDSFSNYQNYNTAHYLTAAQDHEEQPYDLFIYQFENHVSSHFARAHVGLIPGLVIFHHINFIDYGAESFLNSPWTNILTQLKESNVNWPDRKIQYLPLGPFGHRETAFALQGLFTNPQNLSEYKNNLNPNAISSKYDLAPKHLAFPVDVKKEVARVSNLQLATTSKPTISQRMPQFLKALKNNPEWKLLWLIEKSEQEAANAMVQEFEVGAQVEFRFGRTVGNWENTLQEASVAVHLLFSVFEQPCPYLPMSMAKGKVIIASDSGYADYLPDDLVFKIPLGIGEAEFISKLLFELKSYVCEEVSNNVASYAREHFAIELVSKELETVILDNLLSYQRFYVDWRRLRTEAKKSLINEVVGLINHQSRDLPDSFSWEEDLHAHFEKLNWSIST